MPLLEEVFKVSGVPTYTLVKPQRYNEIKVSVRTPGRCLVIEGPSGIGKTTTISTIISELELDAKVTLLTARKPADIAIIQALPDMSDIGLVVVDDFHRLDLETKKRLSDFMKILADTGDENSKLMGTSKNCA